ncbi:MAG: phage tail protein [Methylococcaceae bacterium]|nr:phage tail protein [Methylococcaceae bacterium]
MSEPFIGEIRPFAFNIIPRGWASCDGQVLPINQNQALFSLLGNQYGGNGTTTFALPDLRGRVGVHVGSLYPQGQPGGQEAVQLTLTQMPLHSHAVSCNKNPGDATTPGGNYWAENSDGYGVYSSTGGATMHPAAIGNAGGNQPHENMQPYLVMNFCIALNGIFPSQS